MTKEVSLNGWVLPATQYYKRLLTELSKEECETRGIYIGQDYKGLDDYGNDIFEDAGYTPYHENIVVLQEGMWVVGPDPTGQFLNFTEQQFDLLFKE